VVSPSERNVSFEHREVLLSQYTSEHAGIAEVRAGSKNMCTRSVCGGSFRDKMKIRGLARSPASAGPQLRVYTSCRVRGYGEAEGRLAGRRRGEAGLGGQEGYRCIALVRPPLLRSSASSSFHFYSGPGRASSHFPLLFLLFILGERARPSFPPSSLPPPPPACPDPPYVPGPGVQSLTFHRARLIAVAVTYCAIRCTRALSRLSALRRGCGARGARARARNEGALYGARLQTRVRTYRSRENCVYSLTYVRPTGIAAAGWQ